MGKGSEPEVKENEAIIVGEKVGVNVSDSGNQVTNVGDKPVRTSDDLFAAVRYGGFKSLDTVQNLLTDYPQFVNERDVNGYTVAHWAAKSGDVNMLELLHQHGCDLSSPTQAETAMQPIHWAVSDGKIACLKFLLDNRVDINCQDGRGCTPLIIASQHDQKNCIIYLVTNGADLSVKDESGDTALHWAAYKGFQEIAGLLFHYYPQALEMEDNYGQRPAHLATIRGQGDTLEYLLNDCGADINAKDKNSATLLDHAIRKQQLACEWVIRTALYPDIVSMIRSLPMKRVMHPKILTLLFLAPNDRGLAKWPWRIVCASNALGTYFTLIFAFSESLSDLSFLHLINTMLACIWWGCFIMCLQDNTAIVQDKLTADNNTVSIYESALLAIGNSTNHDDIPNLCHSCHVRRPLRSKHCRFQRKCINKFDHFCPYVYNTVSRDNYKWFMGVVFFHALVSIFWMTTAAYMMSRESCSFGFYVFVGYLLLWCGMIGGLLQFHLVLITKNMTTNEHIGAYKYDYLKNDHGHFDNPFDKGTPTANLLDGLFPSKKDYYSREEVLRDRMNQKRSPCCSKEGGCGKDHQHAEQSKGLLSKVEMSV